MTKSSMQAWWSVPAARNDLFAAAADHFSIEIECLTVSGDKFSRKVRFLLRVRKWMDFVSVSVSVCVRARERDSKCECMSSVFFFFSPPPSRRNYGCASTILWTRALSQFETEILCMHGD